MIPNRRSILLPFLFLAAVAVGLSQPQELVAIPGIAVVKVSAGEEAPADRLERIMNPGVTQGAIPQIRSIEPWLLPSLVMSRHHRALPRRSATTPDALLNILRVAFDPNIDPIAVARAIAMLPGIDYAEAVYPRHLDFQYNDPLRQQQWYLNEIEADSGWGLQTGDTSLIVGIVDTGIDPNHPDLRNALARNPGEQGTDPMGNDRRNNGVDDDANGVVDDWRGYDFGGDNGISADNDPSPHHWHGTHVAGIVGAQSNNAIGIVGVAHGVRILTIKVSDDNANDPTIVNGYNGILYAALSGARVINCSWGGVGLCARSRRLLILLLRWAA